MNGQMYQAQTLQAQNDPNQSYRSKKVRGVAACLCLYLGVLGIHRFYVGKIGTGLLWLFTGGLFTIGATCDLIMILCGSFKDRSGACLK